MRKIIISIGFGLLASSALQAENLADVYKQALENDPTFAAAKQEFLATQEIKNQSFALFLPAISLGANYTNINQKYTVAGIDTKYDYNTNSYGLNLKQMIYRHEYFVQYKQANYQVAQASANFNNATQELILRVSQRYFDILGAIDNLDFTVAEKKSIEEQLNQTKQRFEVGLTAITDVHEAQARYDQSVAQTIAAENLLAISRENLREITGQQPENIAQLAADTPLVKPDPEDIEQWTEIAGKQSLSLIAAEKAMQIAREEVNLQRAGHYPTLDLVANQTYSSSDGGAFIGFTGKDQEETRIGLQFNLPLYEGGRVNSKTSQATFQYNQSKDLYERQRRTTENQTRSAYLNVLANISQVLAYEQALKSSRTALEATEAGYEVGTRTAVDVLNSRREVFRAERDYAKSRYAYILETLSLRQAAGTLSDDAVNAITRWLK
ncbi:Outer membrane channel TolC (OpmH) [hydrothermal vent metagenome]|uniref:Outer membrane channel TolC (OpmH) n=1 Tax=hydrothermal vent metagenome TaxID=652676 RepID=A0A3B1AW61_9ZZZZ